MLDFFHQQLMFAVDRRYLHNTSEPNLGVSIHARVPQPFSRVPAQARVSDMPSMAALKKLATYFRYLADPDGDSSWRSYHRRGTSEAPYHQMEAHLWKALESTLCDIAFIETKCKSRCEFYRKSFSWPSLPPARLHGHDLRPCGGLFKCGQDLASAPRQRPRRHPEEARRVSPFCASQSLHLGLQVEY